MTAREYEAVIYAAQRDLRVQRRRLERLESQRPSSKRDHLIRVKEERIKTYEGAIRKLGAELAELTTPA
jgi:hypothetical protein